MFGCVQMNGEPRQERSEIEEMSGVTHVDEWREASQRQFGEENERRLTSHE